MSPSGVPVTKAMKQRVYEVLEVARPGDRVSRTFDILLAVLISLNVTGLVVGTVDSIFETAPRVFELLDTVSVGVFSVEYVLRVWCCTSDPRYSQPVWGRLRFMVSPMMLVDLLAILPFYIVPLLQLEHLDLRFFRVLRLASRTARLTRYSSGFQNLAAALTSRRQELATVVAVLLVLLVLASSMMFYLERGAQPDKFPHIPAAMWWSVITLTTVGYGDVAPVTGGGRVVAGLIAILGIGLFALPAGILGSGFLEQFERQRRTETRTCPHCGEEIHS